MEAGCNTNHIVERFEGYFSVFGDIFDKIFSRNDYKINATIVLQKLQEKTVDSVKLKSFLKSLPEERWTLSVISERMAELNDVFGITNEEIKKECVTNVSLKDITHIKWEVMKQSMLESSRFANEYYDALKYNNNAKLSISKRKLLNELMLVFDFIRDSSKKVYASFENSKYTEKNLEKFNLVRLSIDLLWLRILYTIVNSENMSDKKIEYLTGILAKERISISCQKIPIRQ